jgi:hypothetical protein
LLSITNIFWKKSGFPYRIWESWLIKRNPKRWTEVDFQDWVSLSLSDRGISVEKLLEKIGVKKNLKNHFTENWFRQQLTQGFQERNLWIC